jgi:hypothetical protein
MGGSPKWHFYLTGWESSDDFFRTRARERKLILSAPCAVRAFPSLCGICSVARFQRPIYYVASNYCGRSLGFRTHWLHVLSWALSKASQAAGRRNTFA